jgi:putative transposase
MYLTLKKEATSRRPPTSATAGPLRQICLGRKKINFSRVRPDKPSESKCTTTSGPVSFVDYDLGYVNLETRVLEPLENPFRPKVLPMS